MPHFLYQEFLSYNVMLKSFGMLIDPLKYIETLISFKYVQVSGQESSKALVRFSMKSLIQNTKNHCLKPLKLRVIIEKFWLMRSHVLGNNFSKKKKSWTTTMFFSNSFYHTEYIEPGVIFAKLANITGLFWRE